MDGDLGCVVLGDTLVAPVVVTDGSRVPADPAQLPTFRVYGEGGAQIANSQGSAAKLDTGSITAATNASPVVVTEANHGLQTGMRVTNSGVLGNTAANGTFSVTKVNANSYSLDGSSGNAAYTSGGTRHVTGLYSLTIEAEAGDGYEAGKTYHAVVTWTLSSVTYVASYCFRVI